jgi:predicted CoA-binding protein
VTALHEDAMREAIAADGEAQRALLAGAHPRATLQRAANRYRASWEAAPPRSFGRLVGYAKASILAGDDPSGYVREQLGNEGDSPPAWWALALAALAADDDALAWRAADGMRAGSEAFGRAADAVAALARRDREAYAAAVQAILADFEARETHLTGVPIADTALVLERLAERHGFAAHPRSPLLPPVDDVRAILTGTRVWAVVGCSPDPSRDSHRIASMLQRRGYDVIPVNPMATEILGERSYPSLGAIPADLGVEVVDVFRRSSAAGKHVDEAVGIGARAVWMQLGVVDEAAAERGRAAGLRVVMDRCPAIELPRLGL